MARLLFVPYPEAGHLNPAFALGRLASQRGHDVVFTAMADVQPEIERAGFPCLPFFPELLPEGTLERLQTVKGRREFRELLSTLERFLRKVVDGAFGRLLREAEPALVVVDAMMAFLSLAAYGEGIPAAVLHTGLPYARADLPPLTSPLLPGCGLWYRLRVTRHTLPGRLRRGLSGFVLRRLYPALDLTRPVRELAAAVGYPRDGLNLREHPAHMLSGIPELIVCPEAFDFPRPPRANRLYLCSAIRWDRPEDDTFPWDRLDPGKPLIYCALGTVSQRYTGASELRRAVSEAMRLRPGWQLVMATGEGPPAEGSEPPNVIKVRHAPQLALLARAAAFITHAGLNSVKEAIAHGVPMLACPMANDQPGNAARLAYHGLGIVVDQRYPTPAYLSAALERLLADTPHRAAVAAMQRMFLELERSAHSVQVLESLL